MGFNVITIWECQLRPAVAQATLDSLLVTMSQIVLGTMGAGQESSPAAIAAEPATPYGD